MTSDIGISKQFATGIVGVFLSLNFILHFFGGFAGGKIISNRNLLLLGTVMELIGIVLIKKNLYLGLGIFLTGSGCSVTSINAIMIQKYEPNDERREIASFWLYSGMNLGFFVGHTVSGYFHIQRNYQWLFNSSVIASVIAIIFMYVNWTKFSDKSTELSKQTHSSQNNRFLLSLCFIPVLVFIVINSLIYHSYSSKFVMILGLIIFSSTFILALKQKTKYDKNKIFAFLILVMAALIFWSLFFIGPMGMTLFIKEYVNKSVMGFELPPQWFNNINTGIIVIGGPVLANWFKRKRNQGLDLSFPFLFSIALLCIGIAYLLLTLGISFAGDKKVVSMVWVILSFILQTVGELFLSPVGVAMIGKLAPQGNQGLLLGIWSMVSGIASMISKYLSQMMVIPLTESGSFSGIQQFSHIFNFVGIGAVLMGFLLFLMVPYIQKLMGDRSQGDLYGLKERLVNNT